MGPDVACNELAASRTVGELHVTASGDAREGSTGSRSRAMWRRPTAVATRSAGSVQPEPTSN
jgi:hypothetical protein